MSSYVGVCLQGPRRSTNRDECTYTHLASVSVSVCVSCFRSRVLPASGSHLFSVSRVQSIVHEWCYVHGCVLLGSP